MGRPREFDEDGVLERALHVFWRLGYEATSVTDLMEATGLAKGSLYKAFGDKRSLFLKALDRYLERGRDALRHTLTDAPTVREGLERFTLERFVKEDVIPSEARNLQVVG